DIPLPQQLRELAGSVPPGSEGGERARVTEVRVLIEVRDEAHQPEQGDDGEREHDAGPAPAAPRRLSVDGARGPSVDGASSGRRGGRARRGTPCRGHTHAGLPGPAEPAGFAVASASGSGSAATAATAATAAAWTRIAASSSA